MCARARVYVRKQQKKMWEGMDKRKSINAAKRQMDAVSRAKP